MNWVGGARSRLKVPNERKLQKEHFERRRLDTRLSRGPTLHQSSTAPVSKDLLFLSKTAENDFNDRSPRAVPIRVNLDSAARHPSMRDLELPMSPIEKPSVLELADTSVISLDNSFYRPPLNTASIPRVSTMKLPRGPAANQRREDRMDVSCMTEALFAVSRPPPVQEKHQSTTDGRVPNNQYSLDYLLNASQIKESHLSRPQRAEQNQRPSKCVPRHADELLWANLDGGLGRKRTAPSAIESETKRAAIRPQKDLGYDFGGWMSKFKTAANHAPKMELVHDKDAMLEIYYAPKQTTKIDYTSLFDGPPGEKQQQRKKEKQPRPRSSLLTENPFSNHHLPSPKMKPKKPQNPIKQENNIISRHSDVTIHNESILGPIKKKQTENEQPFMKKDKATAFEMMMSSFEDSHCDQGNDVEDVIVGLVHSIDTPAEISVEDTSQKKNQHSRWKDFVSLGESTSKERPCDKLINKLPAKEKKNMNCSAWEELACLEREVLTGLDTCTQELTLSPIDCTEDPIMRIVPDVTDKIPLIMCPFDSSQESSLSANSHSENYSQSQRKPPNQQEPETTCSQGETKSAEDAKLYVPRIAENTNTSCSVTAMDTIETRVPLPPVVNIVSTTAEVTNVAVNDYIKLSPVFENSVPAKLFATLSTQTTPSDVYHSTTTKHQEQQTTSVASTRSSPMEVTQSRLPESASPDVKKENMSLKNASVQAGPSNMSELTALKEEVDKLQEELKSAESTIVWLSLMMRIKDI